MNSETPETPEPIFPAEPDLSATDVPETESVTSDIWEEESELNLPETPSEELELNRKDEAESKIEPVPEVGAKVTELEIQERSLRESIEKLNLEYEELQQRQMAGTQAILARMVQESVAELEQRKQALQLAVEQLEKRRDRIKEEMRKNFAGVSQEIAVRVQGFKDYLVGSLQDLASAAEQLDLPTPDTFTQSPEAPRGEAAAKETEGNAVNPQFSESSFQATSKQIRGLLDKYRNRPDYYGPPWQLRRTFEPVHAQRVSNWFFTQGARGAVPSLGSRLQNILVAAATISILRRLYGDRLRTLVLVNSPERLGEWRRGLQDCLGISRGDFSQDRGVTLFEAPEPLAIKADRLLKEGQMPLVIIDETENQVSLGILQFPLWLAFAPDPQKMASMDDFGF
jgi:molecular chaperone GrpE (heat shock protein)